MITSTTKDARVAHISTNLRWYLLGTFNILAASRLFYCQRSTSLPHRSFPNSGSRILSSVFQESSGQCHSRRFYFRPVRHIGVTPLVRHHVYRQTCLRRSDENTAGKTPDRRLQTTLWVISEPALHVPTDLTAFNGGRVVQNCEGRVSMPYLLPLSIRLSLHTAPTQPKPGLNNLVKPDLPVSYGVSRVQVFFARRSLF